MTKRSNLVHRARRASGAGLVTAIFLLVVLAGLGVAIVTVFTSQQASSNLDVQGRRPTRQRAPASSGDCSGNCAAIIAAADRLRCPLTAPSPGSR